MLRLSKTVEHVTLSSTLSTSDRGPMGILAVLALTAGLLALPMQAVDASVARATDDLELTDQAITDAVEDEMRFDAAVPGQRIDVTTDDGIVTLEGAADSLLASERATRLARTVKGVRSVINRVEIRPVVPRTDDEIRRDVESALLRDPATDSYELQVAVYDGAVHLSGDVDSWQEKHLARQVAAGVSGVLAVEDTITLTPAAERPDHEIRAEVEQALRWDALVDEHLVDVEVADGVVMLQGTVGSAAEKSQAMVDAWVAGVSDVRDTGLTIRDWAEDERRRSSPVTTASDIEIHDAIEDALLYDPRVAAFEITPSVARRVVTLRGTVDNLKARRAAGQVARNTVGVLRVENRLKVAPPTEITSAEVESWASDAVARDPYLEAHEIDVETRDGMVTLTGAVDSVFEKAHATDIVSRVTGVESIDNRLTVNGATDTMAYDPWVDRHDPTVWNPFHYRPTRTFKSDAEIVEDVRDELWWSPFVDADQVTVMVDDGVVTLEGNVDSWAERSAATENAFDGGATWVDNDLVVETGTS